MFLPALPKYPVLTATGMYHLIKKCKSLQCKETVSFRSSSTLRQHSGRCRRGNVTFYTDIKEALKEFKEWSGKMPKERRGGGNLKRRY